MQLDGDLQIPKGARSVVIFAHGSGSGRLSPRNQAVAAGLVDAGMATLLIDLLTEDEAEHRANIFDIGLLTGRVVDAVAWARSAPPLLGFPIGLFGASTGAAAALKAAAASPDDVAAVVSRGGRPDLAGADLDLVVAPTLLIVGGQDEPVLSWNREAARRIGHCRLEVVAGATHLFEEPDALEQVMALAEAWFSEHLG
jgi:dienelactone hydrolase